jgi:putative membrane protein insertion efficiency factor
VTASLLKGVVRLYQMTLSPVVGGACRFDPSCSAYALQAIDRHGARKGVKLAGTRLMRCHPFASAGYDPVPDIDEGGQGRG